MATIDTSIYSQLLRPPKSVAEYDAEAMQTQQNRLALQVQQGQLAAQQAGVARTNRLATVLGGFKPGLSAAEQGDALTRSGFIDEGRKVVESGAKANKDMREGEKAQREAEKFQFEQARDQIGFVNQIIGSAKDQASYTQGRQAMAARGLDVSQIPEQYDPAYVQSAGAQTLTQLQRIDDAWKAKGFDLDVQKFGETVRSNKAGESLTARGQNMTASTARRGQDLTENRLRNEPKGVIVQTDTGPLLVDPRSGTSKPVLDGEGAPVQAKLKPLPAQVQKGLMENSAALRKVNDAITAVNKYPAALGAKNYLGDSIRQRSDPEGINARALVADIGSLKLHDRSGAAVTASETPRLLPFIPSPTDDAETVKRKLGLFQNEYNAIEQEIRETYSREQGYKLPQERKQPATPSGSTQAYADAEKERRYQEFKAKQGQK